jgi:hypothetical protein
MGLPTNIIGNTEHHDMEGCWRCKTDWEASIEWADTGRGWTVIVRIYQELGNCRLPHDPKWQAMTSRYKQFRGVARGAVKALWESIKPLCEANVPRIAGVVQGVMVLRVGISS